MMTRSRSLMLTLSLVRLRIQHQRNLHHLRLGQTWTTVMVRFLLRQCPEAGSRMKVSDMPYQLCDISRTCIRFGMHES